MLLDSTKARAGSLEAFMVDNGWSRLVVLLLRDPHLLESGQGSQDGTTDPDRVLSLRRSNDLDLHRRWSQGSDLFLHTLSNTWEQSSTTRHNNVTVQLLSDVDVTPDDRVVSGIVNTHSLQAQVSRTEQCLCSSESLVTDGDNLTVRQLVRLLNGRGLRGGCHLLVEVQSDVTQLLLNVTHNFSLRRGGEGVTTLRQDLHQVVGQVSTSQVESQDTVRQRETSVYWHQVSNTVTGVQNNTGGSTRRVQRQDSLNVDVEGWDVEGLEHDLGHFFSVGLRVHGGLGQQDGVLLWSNSQLVVERVVPDLLHVVPVVDDTMLNRVFQGQYTSLGLSLVTNVGVLLAHADHDTLVSWSADDRGENGTWSVIAGETGFAHTRTIVNDQCCDFFCYS